jgi:hypothetical protein
MLEKELEQKLVKAVSACGAVAWKLSSPGHAGVPDRILLLPGGQVLFVEMKRPGEKQRPLQVHVARTLRVLGFPVEVVDSEAGIDEIVQLVRQLSKGQS